MKQKVIQIGNSSGIILPKNLMIQAGIRTGSEVKIEQVPNGQGLIVSKIGKSFSQSSITPHFLRVVERVNKRYAAAFKELATK